MKTFRFALGFAAVALFAASGCQSQGGSNSTSNEMVVNPACNKLSDEEQSFAEMLSAKNQQLYCSQFTMQQRKNAMYMARHGDYQYGRGKTYTPNQAVESVAGITRQQSRNYKRACANN